MSEKINLELRSKLQANAHELYVMSTEEFKEIASKITLDKAKLVAGYVAPANDVRTVAQIVIELGLQGKVVEKIVNGKHYVILKGYPGLRKTLRGTRYLANNPKIMTLAIGKVGVGKSIISGMKLTVLLTVPLTVLKYILDDNSTLASLLGTVASDLMKLSISSVVGAAAAAVVGTITTIAAGPLAAAVVFGVATAIFLEKIDADYGLTDALVKLIDETYDSFYDNTIGAFVRSFLELERLMDWQVRNGVSLGKGIFY